MRLRSGVSAAAGRASLQRIAEAANKVFAADPNAAGNNVTVLGVQRPVQIVNYRSIGSTPVILAVGLAVGAIVALALTLVASVRHRRRDLALLKALGFTPRQLASVVAWQSTVTAVVGVIVGVPLGIVIGRQLWTLFARNINAVPDPTVPVVSRGSRRPRRARLRQRRGGNPGSNRGTDPNGLGAESGVRCRTNARRAPFRPTQFIRQGRPRTSRH